MHKIVSANKIFFIGLIACLLVIINLLNIDVYAQSNKYPRQRTRPPDQNSQTLEPSTKANKDVINNTVFNDGSKVMSAVIKNGDTLYIYELEEIVIYAPREFSNRFQQMRYNRLVRNVKKVYPYAKIAGEKFRVYNEILINETNEIRRNMLMKRAEDELRASFEKELRGLTISQGLILVKLIDRETSQTTYEVLQEFRGAAAAVFWQGLGRLFGYNLRVEYDPVGEDKMIEEIIQMIEAGAI